MGPVAFIFGSSPPDDGTLDTVNGARLATAVDLWTRGLVTHLVCMGRRSNARWPESEAAYLARHLRQLCWQAGKPIPADLVFIDERPKSTSETIQLLPQWEDHLAGKEGHIGSMLLVTNAIYRKQVNLLLEMTDVRYKVRGAIFFQGAPDVLGGKTRRVRMAELKAAVDPYDRWVNQFRINEKRLRTTQALLRLVDLGLIAWLLLWRRLGFTPRPRKSLPAWPAQVNA